MIVEGSIMQMFQAAVIPGVIAVFSFITVIALLVRLKPGTAPLAETMDAASRRQALSRLAPVVVIFGGIILGLGIACSRHPAAAIGVFVILAYGLLLRLRGEGLGGEGIRRSLLETAVTAGMIYFILFGAEVVKGFFSGPACQPRWPIGPVPAGSPRGSSSSSCWPS
jgi:TRAP-type C4-dicarboxylate transport system permease large subunit